jgi:diguanylate cyclase (GGDEF)-like protein
VNGTDETERRAVADSSVAWQPRGYLRLSRLLPTRSYVGKVLLVAVIGTHLPLIALIFYVLGIARLNLVEALSILVVGLIATLVGSALTVLALRVLLAPVALASRSLRLARLSGEWPALPTDVDDEGGRLLAETQRTLDSLGTIIKQLEQEAATDELTGMLNRRAGERRLQAALNAPHRPAERLAVALLDVDGMKNVNDRWGHAAGDAALVHLVSVLIEHVGRQGWVARWGGDEFLVVLAESDAAEPAEAILTAVATEVAATPLAVAGTGEARLGVSWGLVWPTAGEGTVNVVGRADAALYRNKHQAREIVAD